MRFSDYEAVVGLEVHAELKTATKIYCACPTGFGAPPNTLCCPVCLGLPGALPTLNRRAVELAVKAGLALGCGISTLSRTDRKQYFYPDLPKAYQISQDPYPLCFKGGLNVRTEQGERRIGIRRIHIEEDAGKLIHTGERTLIDCNRCGVPLIEIVTDPEMHSPEEAGAFLRGLRDILVACGVSDCKMHEGSMRCDVNISLRKKGGEELGTRCEIKNINSFAFVEKAIAYEMQRQFALLADGAKMKNETRRYDSAKGITELMRVKERAADYRYLAEPDLPSILLTEEEIEAIRLTLPELPQAKASRLCREYGIAAADAEILMGDSDLAAYFEQAARQSAYPKTLVHLLLTELLRLSKGEIFASPVKAESLAALADLVGNGTVNSSTAKKLLLRLCEADLDVVRTVQEEGLTQLTDPDVLREVVAAVLEEEARAVADFCAGKKVAANALLGKAMKKTGGKAEPRLLEQLLWQALQNKNGG